jgi:flagellum-specific peptidoglycan hydrolase FlgJ
MTQKRNQIIKEAEQEIEVPKYTLLKKILQIIFLSLTLFFLNVGAKTPVISNNTINSVVQLEQNSVDTVMYPKLVRQRIQSELVNDVKKYMDYVAPTNKIDAELFVTKCQEYNMDIVIALAQAVLESHLGTKGKATTTHSIFNVGAFDNGQTMYTYKNVNESIEPFLQLIKNEYLGDKRNVSDLIKDGGYRNLQGHRYATSWAYESRLRTIMVHVDMNSSISMYQDVMNLPDDKILAFFGPVKQNNDTINYTALK